MKISSDGLYELRLDGKNIVLQYETEQKAFNAKQVIQRENDKFIKENFPDGIF